MKPKNFLELSEAQIETIIHPESLIHAMVGFHDGGMMAHVGPPDMRHAIGFALHYPVRRPLDVARLDLTQIGQFRFYAADEARYPALRLAREVMRQGHLWGAAFNAAKEVALDRFIAGDIGFLDMAILVEKALHDMDRAGLLGTAPRDLPDVLQADQATRERARTIDV